MNKYSALIAAFRRGRNDDAPAESEQVEAPTLPVFVFREENQEEAMARMREVNRPHANIPLGMD